GDGLSDADETALGTCVSSSQTGCSGNCATAQSTLPKTTDTDCDGITDTDEVTGLTDPTKADTDGDGTLDNTDTVQFNSCTSGTLGVPALLGPISTQATNQLAPQASWSNNFAAIGARIDLSSSWTFQTGA